MSTSVPWSATLDLLARERVRDVLVVAVRSGSEPDLPATTMGRIYFELEHGCLQFNAVNSYGGLQARPLEAVDMRLYREEFGLDAFPVRLGHLFFGETDAVYCLRVDYVTNEESDLDQGIVRSAELTFSQGHRVVLDPMYTTGVRIGNTDPWWQDIESGPWTFHRHTWLPSQVRGPGGPAR